METTTSENLFFNIFRYHQKIYITFSVRAIISENFFVLFQCVLAPIIKSSDILGILNFYQTKLDKHVLPIYVKP